MRTHLELFFGAMNIHGPIFNLVDFNKQVVKLNIST